MSSSVPSPVPAGTEPDAWLIERIEAEHEPGLTFGICGCRYEFDTLPEWAAHVHTALTAVVSSSPATPEGGRAETRRCPTWDDNGAQCAGLPGHEGSDFIYADRVSAKWAWQEGFEAGVQHQSATDEWWADLHGPNRLPEPAEPLNPYMGGTQ